MIGLPIIRTKRYSTIMSTILKEGRKGKVKLTKKTISKGTKIRTYDWRQGCFYDGTMDASMPIVMLSEGKSIWMSDTPQEQESLVPVIQRARGDVLMGGLGIGYLPTRLMRKAEVKSITIVEKNQDVIALVYPQIWGPKTNIIVGDIFDYLIGTDKRYDFIHVDIWMGILQPLKGIQRVRNLAKTCLKPNGEVHCWAQELYDRVKDAIPKQPTISSGVGVHDPCLICGKCLRNNYAGLCMDCADILGVSEIFMSKREA